MLENLSSEKQGKQGCLKRNRLNQEELLSENMIETSPSKSRGMKKGMQMS